MTTFFLNRLATEPHALAFAGQSTPWPVALADQTTDPSLDEALRGHVAAANRLLTPVAADLLTTTGRPVDLFGFAPNPARLGAAADATASVEGVALTQLGALLDLEHLGYSVAQAKPLAVLGHSQGVLAVHMTRAIEAAGDVDILMLDKTGTITLGNRQAAEFIPVDGVDPAELADAAQLSSLADETPEGRSIVVLAKEQFGLRGRTLEDKGMEFIPFTAATRMSGVNYAGSEIRKGAADSVRAYVEAAGGVFSKECDEAVERIAKVGGTPLVVAKNRRVLGVVYLKDIIKSGVKEKFADLRRMGIKTIMVTGDNPLTAAAIAAEAGVDDFLAEATPEGKLE